MPAPDYLNPALPDGLRRVRMPVVDATDAALEGYGKLVDDPSVVQCCDRALARRADGGPWTKTPATRAGRPRVCSSANGAATSCTAATKRSTVITSWRTTSEPSRADETHGRPPSRMMLWHCNYHPDGGQLFFPLDKAAVLRAARVARRRRQAGAVRTSVSTARAGSTSIRTCGTKACSRDAARSASTTRQGAVHARVSVDFAREFGCLLEAVLE